MPPFDDLLPLLEALPHAERTWRLVEHGRRARTDAAAAAHIAGLAAAPRPWPRLLALVTAFGSADGAQVLRALDDPSRIVRAHAARLVPLACDDAQATAALDRARGARARRAIAEGLAKRRRYAPLDAWIAERLARPSPDGEVLRLLSLASVDVIRSGFGVLLQQTDPSPWARLARVRPALAAEALIAALGAGVGPIEAPLDGAVEAATPVVAARAPEACVDLLAATLRRDATGLLGSSSALAQLARARPTAVFDLLREVSPEIDPTGRFPVRFDRDSDRLGPERLAWLVRHAPGALPDGVDGRRWFLRLADDDRARVLEAWLDSGRSGWGAFLLAFVEPTKGRSAALRSWSDAVRSRQGTIAPTTLAALPVDLRHAEARRHLHDVPSLAIDPTLRTAYAHLLPWDEARAAVVRQLTDPDGSTRAQGVAALIGAVARDRARIGDAIDLVVSRRFEQDRVRSAALVALVALPIIAFRGLDVTRLDPIVDHALAAPDRSLETTTALTSLVIRLASVDPGWSAAAFERVLVAHGAPAVSSAAITWLAQAHAAPLREAAGRVAERWSREDAFVSLLQLAGTLDLRLADVVPVIEALERIVRTHAQLHFVWVAVRLLHRHVPDRLGALVPDALVEDPSLVVDRSIAAIAVRRRPDLVAAAIDGHVTGRFATGRTWWATLVAAPLHCATEPMQDRIAAALGRGLTALGDHALSRDELVLRLRGLTRLPCSSPAPVLAAIADERELVRDLALGAAGRLDGDEADAALLVALEDDRARRAVFTLRARLRRRNPAEIRRLLSDVPRRTLGVAKEVVRLLGELGGDEAVPELVRTWSEARHRDLRLAVLQALVGHVGLPEAWAVIEAAAADPEPTVAFAVADVPLTMVPVARRAAWTALEAGLVRRPERDRTLGVLHGLARHRADEGRAIALDACLRALVEVLPELVDAATTSALALTRREDEAHVVERIVALLPRVRSAAASMEAVDRWRTPWPHDTVGTRVAAALADRLAGEPLWVRHRIRLVAGARAPTELAALIEALAVDDLLHADAVVTACAAASSCKDPEAIERKLATSTHEGARRVAVAALIGAASAGAERGWTDARRERLAAYVQDRSPLVAGAAAFVFPPPVTDA